MGEQLAAESEALAAKVPWIGSAWRWYDVGFRFFVFLSRSRVRKWVGWRGRQFLNRAQNFFIPFNELDRARADRRDRLGHDIKVSEDEHVHTAGIWAVEFVLPSHYSAFLKSLGKSGWDRDNFMRPQDGSNAERVQAARTGQGWLWWTLGTVADPGTLYLSPGAVREPLPKEFVAVTVRAMQIGTSLTAVSAQFTLSDAGQDALDQVWHREHEPSLSWNGLRRPDVENRYFAAIRETQAERQRLHDVARDWLATRVPGFFAATIARQPVCDMLLFDVANLADDPVGRPLQADAIRALGLDRLHLEQISSPNMPGLTLVRSLGSGRGYELARNCWSAVGQLDNASDSASEVGRGPKPYSPSTLAHIYGDEIQAFMTYNAVTRFLTEMSTAYAGARDLAPSRHGRFGVRQLRRLRRELLTRSLDLTMVGRDLGTLWSPYLRSMIGIQVNAGEPHGLPEGMRRRDDFDFIKDLGEFRKRLTRDLRKDDAAYREVLVTVASLGASIETSRTGRRALLVAAASLGVSAVTLFVTDLSSHSVWTHIWHYVYG